MSAYQIEKRRTQVRITMATGTSVVANVFLADATPSGRHPERVGDLLNADRGFFPAEVQDPSATRVSLFNRDHVVTVRLEEPELELDLDASYAIAPRRRVAFVLSNGDLLFGEMHVVAPEGHMRVSDFASTAERFRYLDTADGTYVVNLDHVVEIAQSDIEPKEER